MENTDKTIEGRALITRGDYRALAYFNVFQRSPAEPYIVGGIAFAAIAVVAAWIMPWFHPWKPTFHLSWIFLVLLAAVFLVIEGITHQYLKTEGGMTVGKEFTYRFSQKGVSAATDEAVRQLPWEGFFKGIELKRHYLLFFTINQALIVPKRGFSEEQQRELSQLMKERLGKDYILRHQK